LRHSRPDQDLLPAGTIPRTPSAGCDTALLLSADCAREIALLLRLRPDAHRYSVA